MTDRQAAEARARAEVISETERRIDGKLALTAIANPDVMVPTRTLRALVHEAKQVDALSVRLAQAEQALHERETYAFGLEDKLEASEVRLREYEEALKKIEHYGNRGDWHNDIARAALAASGGREAPKEET